MTGEQKNISGKLLVSIYHHIITTAILRKALKVTFIHRCAILVESGLVVLVKISKS